MTVPAIGAARGLFEIFVPGVFLMLNVGTAVYLLPFTDDVSKTFIKGAASSPVVAALIAVCFGYLVGVVLRLYRCELPDEWSAWWLRRFDKGARKETGSGYKLFAEEHFPYIGWLGEVCEHSLPPSALAFYQNTWASRAASGRNRPFFNFCKAIVASQDSQAAAEMNAAEALSRYLSGMLYALLPASALMIVATIVPFMMSQSPTLLAPVLAIGYLCAIMAILAHYRFIRIKEVELVFASCFRNRSVFEGVGKGSDAYVGAV